MMQENGEKSPLLVVFTFLLRRNMRVNKRKKRVKPFRVLAVALTIATVALMTSFPKKDVSLQNQQAQLASASDEYRRAQSKNNQLKAELGEVDTADFVERTARRDYGYCWYGETVYEIANLDELLTLARVTADSGN